MSIKWKRPESVPFPSIWKRFEGKREINGKIPKFWIQDISEDLFEDAVNAMSQSFIYEEPLCKYSAMFDCPESVAEIQERWRLVLKHKMALICFMENPDPNGKPIIAGLNITYICEKDDPKPQFQAKKWLKVADTVRYLCLVKDPFEMLGIDFYLSALGLSVLPEFRGQNIGLELLLARVDLCKATGVPATLTVFSAIRSQKLAERAGYKDVACLTYEEIKEKEPDFNFPGISEENKYIRYMYKMI